MSTNQPHASAGTAEGAAAKSPTVIITGSSGLIGTGLCRRLAGDYHILGFDHGPPEDDVAALEGFEHIHCDLTRDDDVSKALDEAKSRSGGRLASVIHLAAYYDFSGEESPLYDELTVEGTRRVLRGLRQFEQVDQFLFTSSLLVMKPAPPGERLNEESPTEAEWPYPQSKLKTEQLIHLERGDIPTLILRIAGVYDEMCHSIPIAQNIRRIAEKELESYLFPGNPHHGQTFIHDDDVADCLAAAVQRRQALESEEVLLVGEDECLTFAELQDEIGNLLHGVDDWPTIRIPAFVAKAGAWMQQKLASSPEEAPFIQPWMVDLADAHYPVDSSKAKQLLGWAPRRKLSETLPEMIRRLKEDPAGWYRANDLQLPDQKELQRMSATS